MTLKPADIIWVLTSYILAVVITCVLASLFQTWFVLVALEDLGAQLSLDIWFHTGLHDLYGLSFGGKYVSYGQAILIGFAIALPTAALCHKLVPLPRALIYSLAGATAIAAILFIVKLNFYGLVLFAGTRGIAGFSAQVAAGALGGLVFSSLILKRQYHHGSNVHD